MPEPSLTRRDGAADQCRGVVLLLHAGRDASIETVSRRHLCSLAMLEVSLYAESLAERLGR